MEASTYFHQSFEETRNFIGEAPWREKNLCVKDGKSLAVRGPRILPLVLPGFDSPCSYSRRYEAHEDRRLWAKAVPQKK